MIFIASVIAKKGVVVIADSLATFSEKVVTYEYLMNYLMRKQGNANSNEIRIREDYFHSRLGVEDQMYYDMERERL